MFAGVVRKLLAGSILSAIAILACSTFGSSENAPIVNEDGGASDAPPSPDVAPSDAVATEAAGFDASCDAATPPGLVYEAALDVTCDGWSVANGTITRVGDPTRCGAGSCRVCGGQNGPGQATLRREILVAKTNGTFELAYAVRGDTYAGELSAGLDVIDETNGRTGFGTNTATVVPGVWSDNQIIAGNTSGTAKKAIVNIVSSYDGGTLCYFVDEIRLGHY